MDSLAEYQNFVIIKIAGKVTMILNEQALQADLDRIACRANQWQIKFNADKGKASHFGNNINRVQYVMKCQQLSAVSKEKDL